jgi:hypothetical protein
MAKAIIDGGRLLKMAVQAALVAGAQMLLAEDLKALPEYRFQECLVC